MSRASIITQLQDYLKLSLTLQIELISPACKYESTGSVQINENHLDKLISSNYFKLTPCSQVKEWNIIKTAEHTEFFPNVLRLREGAECSIKWRGWSKVICWTLPSILVFHILGRQIKQKKKKALLFKKKNESKEYSYFLDARRKEMMEQGRYSQSQIRQQKLRNLSRM